MQTIISGCADAFSDMNFSLGKGSSERAEAVGGTVLKIFCSFVNILLIPFCYCYRRPLGSFVLVAAVLNGWVIWNVVHGLMSKHAEACGATLIAMLCVNGALAVFNIVYMCFASVFITGSMKGFCGQKEEGKEDHYVRTLAELSDRYSKLLSKSVWTVVFFFGAIVGTGLNTFFAMQAHGCFRSTKYFTDSATTLQFYWMFTLLQGMLFYCNLCTCHQGIETDENGNLTDVYDIVGPGGAKALREQMEREKSQKEAAIPTVPAAPLEQPLLADKA